MKHILYCLVQCTWGILQSTLGLFNFLLHIRCRHYFYGHTIQSLILGPLYLSYFSFFTEKWANYLGEQVTGEKSMESFVID